MNKLMIGGMIVIGVLFFLGTSGGIMRQSDGGFRSSAGPGFKSYASSSRSAVRGIGNAAGGILK